MILKALIMILIAGIGYVLWDVIPFASILFWLIATVMLMFIVNDTLLLNAYDRGILRRTKCGHCLKDLRGEIFSGEKVCRKCGSVI